MKNKLAILLIIVFVAVSLPLIFLNTNSNKVLAEEYYESDISYGLTYAPKYSNNNPTIPSTITTGSWSINAYTTYGNFYVEIYQLRIQSLGTGTSHRYQEVFDARLKLDNTNITNLVLIGWVYYDQSSPKYYYVDGFLNRITFINISDKNTVLNNDPLFDDFYEQMPYNTGITDYTPTAGFSEFWSEIDEDTKILWQTQVEWFNETFDQNVVYEPTSFTEWEDVQIALRSYQAYTNEIQSDLIEVTNNYAPYAGFDFVTNIFSSLGNLLNIRIGAIPLYAFIAIPLILGIIYLIFRLIR